jgi:hypothetical protein
MPRELAPRAPESGRTRDPDDGLQVAQAAGALLDVGLEVVRGIVIFEMPLLLLQCLRVVERAHVERCVERVAKLLVQPPRACEPPVLEQARANRRIGCHLDVALRGRAHGVTDLDADVP